MRASLTPWYRTGAAFTVAAAVILAGCESQATRERLAQLQAVSAEKDSLLAVAAENARLVKDISTELGRVRDARRPLSAVISPESPLTTSLGFHDSLRSRITDVVNRLNAAETRLESSQRRMRSLTAGSDSLAAQARLMEQTVSELRGALESQRETIAVLSAQADSLAARNAELLAQTEALSDSVTRLATETSTVYYVIGSKNELKARGIVTEEGSKFLFFGRKALVPARDLNPNDFTAIDRRAVFEIALPNPDKSYRIVSRHSLRYLNTAQADGKVRGPSLTIRDPADFWEPSPFLIIVQG